VLWVAFSRLGGQVPALVVVFISERGVDSSVEGAFLELGHFSFVGRIYVLEEDQFFSINELIFFATKV
jgi:hypothetical protein